MRFENKTAVVTGSGGGIGEAYARALHAEGANVVIAELDEARGQQVADSLGVSERSLLAPMLVTLQALMLWHQPRLKPLVGLIIW